MSEDLHARVRDELGRSIVVGELPPGSVVRTERLEAQFGVSRSVMREVVRVLVSMNLVEARRSVGVIVCPPERWHPFDPQVIRWRLSGPDRISHLEALGELRAGVEPIAAELAATHASPEQCGELTRHVIDMSIAARRNDDASLLESDIAFHQTLLAASGNPMFAGLSAVVAEVLRGRAEHHLVSEPTTHPEVDLHLAVASAVQGGDGSAARSAMAAVLAQASAEIEAIARPSAPASAAQSSS